MKNFTTILFIIASTVISACQENTESPVGDLLDIGINISVKSAEGTDLLDPDNPGHFAEDQIRIFHLVDGKPVQVYEPDLLAVYGFLLFETGTEYGVQIFANEASTDEYPTTYVQWNETDTDTLKYQIVRKNNNSYVVLSKVWFNDTKVFDLESDTEGCFFQITK